MIMRLAVVTTLIAVFSLSLSVLADASRQRSVAAPMAQDCLAGGLLCAPGAGLRS